MKEEDLEEYLWSICQAEGSGGDARIIAIRGFLRSEVDGKYSRVCEALVSKPTSGHRCQVTTSMDEVRCHQHR